MSPTWLSFFIIPPVVQGVPFRHFCLFSVYCLTVRHKVIHVLPSSFCSIIHTAPVSSYSVTSCLGYRGLPAAQSAPGHFPHLICLLNPCYHLSWTPVWFCHSPIKNNGKLTFVQCLEFVKCCPLLPHLIIETILWNRCYTFLNIS